MISISYNVGEILKTIRVYHTFNVHGDFYRFKYRIDFSSAKSKI